VKTILGLAGVAAAALAAAGCGDGGRRACLPDGGTAPVSSEQTAGTEYLTGVSAARRGCADRIELRFADAVPGYRVEYLPAAQAKTEDASGRHVAIPGSAFLVVRLTGAATARTDGAAVSPTYSGPRRIAVDGHHARALVKTGDFEAVVTWVAGLDAKRPFAVSETDTSLVVEVG
jgi:hypothetical protein